MNIDVYFTPLGLGAGDLGGRGIVVIDVLRATTTIVTALANGAKAVIPAATSEEADPQSRPERHGPGRARPDRAVRQLERGARGLRSRPPARRGGPRGRRDVRRQGGSLRRGPDVREPPHHMTSKARQELVGIGALVVGLFLGLTLLRLPITGSWGERIGSLLWRALGAGSAVLPLLGIGWALAAFERLGSLSSARTAALGVGPVPPLPY